jgi:hypothetical protein
VTENQALDPAHSQLSPVRFQHYLYMTLYNGPIIMSHAPRHVSDTFSRVFEHKLQELQIFSEFIPLNLPSNTAMRKN